MNPPLTSEAFEQLLAELLDSDSATEPPAVENWAEQLSPEQRRELLEQQFAHSLLLEVNRPHHEDSRTIARWWAALEEPVTAAVKENAASRTFGRGRTPRRWGIASTVAAALLVAAMAFWNIGRPAPASATVARALAHAEASRDRTYRVTLRFDAPLDRTTEGTLHVRGGEQFLFRHPGPLGEFHIGSGSEFCWFAPARGPVITSPDQKWLREWVARGGSDMPFLQVTTVLRRLSQSYDLQPLRAGWPPGGGPWCQHVRGRRRDSSGMLPEGIDLWASADSGAVQRLEFTFEDDRPSLLRSLVLQLAAEEPLPADWYEPGRHAPGRPLTPVSELQDPPSPETPN